MGFVAGAIAFIGGLFFLVISFAGLAAWSSYNDRGCPLEISADCVDAYTVSRIAMVASPVSLLVISLLVWFAWRMLRRKDGKAAG
jgi:heme/copper-type cytochrome/quinol oxidase subunit 2